MELREQHFSFQAHTRREAVLGDFAWTTEALGNILKNCMEHTPPGGSILVTARENAIFTEYVDKICAIFQRAQDQGLLTVQIVFTDDSAQRSEGSL